MPTILTDRIPRSPRPTLYATDRIARTSSVGTGLILEQPRYLKAKYFAAKYLTLRVHPGALIPPTAPGTVMTDRVLVSTVGPPTYV